MPKGVYKRTKPVWNKDLTKETDFRIAKMAKATGAALTGRSLSPEHCAAIGIARTGVSQSPECRAAIGKALQDKPKSPEHRAAIGAAFKGKSQSPQQRAITKEAMNRSEVKAKKCAAQKKLWQDPEYKEKQLKAIFKGLGLLPNKPEKFLIKLFQELFPDQWKYVGDGKFWIDGLNPDFIHVTQKKIIEHFGDYHHGEKVTGIPNEQHERERALHFIKKGYQILIIWEYELQDMNVLVEKIQNFTQELVK